MDDTGPRLGWGENGSAAKIIVDETFIRNFLTYQNDIQVKILSLI